MADYELSLDIQEQLLPVTLGLIDNTLSLELAFDGGGGFIPYYGGSYQVTPTGTGFVLPTQGKCMLDNLTVNRVPFSEEENLAGGITVTIL